MKDDHACLIELDVLVGASSCALRQSAQTKAGCDRKVLRGSSQSGAITTFIANRCKQHRTDS